MNHYSTSIELKEVVHLLSKKLHAEDFDNMMEFIEVNEHGVALELLCTQIFEYNIEITTDLYMKILTCAKDLDTPESYTTPLKSLQVSSKKI